MAKKFLAVSRNCPADSDVDHQPEPWKPTHFFFYGSLMDERQIATVLDLDSPPVLSLASVDSYTIKMWGPHPVLVDASPGHVVNGMVYEVQREDHEEALADYETDAYRCAVCCIRPGDGGEPFFGGRVIPTRSFRRGALISKRGRRLELVPLDLEPLEGWASTFPQATSYLCIIGTLLVISTFFFCLLVPCMTNDTDVGETRHISSVGGGLSVRDLPGRRQFRGFCRTGR